ncbi:MAG: hypothetical protein JWM16_1529 [Verrucomicrobiales bacterium]|nr:hypothetical protein [Verrucomicrobiales bacterium]
MVTRVYAFTLNAGDSFTYGFDSAFFTRSHCDLENVGYTFLDVAFKAATFQTGEAFRIEMFETTTLDAPFFDSTFTSVSSVRAYGQTEWRDRQGTFRISMLAGSADLEGFSITVRDSQNPICINTGTVAVPEPRVLSLAILGFAVLFFIRKSSLNGVG